MATSEKPKEQQKKFAVKEDYSDGEDYVSSDDYTDEEYEDEVPQTQNDMQVLQQRRRPLQQQKDNENTDEDEYSSEEYDYEYSDDDGQAMQPFINQDSEKKPSGDMELMHEGEEKSILDEKGLKLRLELNLDIEIELKASIHGDLTLALL